MSPAESKFDEFAGSVFYVFGRGTVVQYYEAVGNFCEFGDISKDAFHFVVIARYSEYVGVLQVLPVLVRLVILERRTHNEDVFKMVLVFFFQHFQEVVCFSTGRHNGDDHVKWCVHFFLVLGGAIKFGRHDVNYSVGNHEDMAGQVRRRGFFFYLHQDSGLRAY